MSLAHLPKASNGDPEELAAPLIAEGLPPPDGPPARLLPTRSAAGEARAILSLGLPLVAEELLGYGSTLIAVAVVGRLPSLAQAAFFAARAVTNITGLATSNGLSAAIETLVSQAHGAQGGAVLGVILQRSLLLMAAAMAPLMGLYLHSEPLLRLAGQAPEVAPLAARYIRLFGPQIFLHSLALCIFRWFVAQGR